MWFVKVNSSDCDIEKITAELPVLMWAYHPIGKVPKTSKPHYHFILDMKYKRSDDLNKKIRPWLKEPKTTSLKSTPCKENWPQDPSSLDTIIAYMKRFTKYQDVWPEAVFWTNPNSEPLLNNVAPQFLKPPEYQEYLRLKVLKNPVKTPPLVEEITIQKSKKKPSQRDLIQHVWDEVQQNLDSQLLDSNDRSAMIKFTYQSFSRKLRNEKLKYDKYQLIQMMNPILCEFADGYNDTLQAAILNHFHNV